MNSPSLSFFLSLSLRLTDYFPRASAPNCRTAAVWQLLSEMVSHNKERKKNPTREKREQRREINARKGFFKTGEIKEPGNEWEGDGRRGGATGGSITEKHLEPCKPLSCFTWSKERWGLCDLQGAEEPVPRCSCCLAGEGSRARLANELTARVCLCYFVACYFEKVQPTDSGGKLTKKKVFQSGLIAVGDWASWSSLS